MKALDLIIEYPNAFPDDICEEIIERFDKDENVSKGYNGLYGPETTTTKVSNDLMISGRPEWSDMDSRLYDILSPYIQNYTDMLRDQFHFEQTGHIKDLGYQIQKTEPGGYFSWHTDDNTEIITDQTYISDVGRKTYCGRDRMFTYILYLNDRYEYEDGQTEFKFGDGNTKLIRPEQGKLILFPANPFFPHRGVPLENGVKYLMTGWVVRDMIYAVEESIDDYDERKARYSGSEYSCITLVDS